MGYDVIGDVHGQADKLQGLLRRLGYHRRGGRWAAPVGRQAVFVGDLIDRGPQQLEVLDTVRRMVDGGVAHVVMGNHEFNAIGWVTPRPGEPGAFLRRHQPSKLKQHAEFLRQVGEGSARHLEWVAWFRTLRPTLDLGGIRVVHAWWHEPHIETVERGWAPGQPMDDAFLHAAYDRTRPEWAAMEGLTKGLEVSLPPGHSFVDDSGHERYEVRARWWLGAAKAGSLREFAVVDEDQRHRVPDVPVPEHTPVPALDGAPVFVGHYWMTGRPAPQTARVACVDYSAGRNGPLVAYRWDGERDLDAAAFVASSD